MKFSDHDKCDFTIFRMCFKDILKDKTAEVQSCY